MLRKLAVRVDIEPKSPKLGAFIDAINAALSDPEVQKRFESAGIVKPRATGPEFLKKYLNDEIEKWGDILRTTKDTD